MGILDVMGRISRWSGKLWPVEIEIEVLIGLAQHMKKQQASFADFASAARAGDELRDRWTSSFLAVSVEHRELHQRDLVLGRQAQRGQAPFTRGM